MIIYLIGYMGSGKTTTGKELAGRLNLVFVDLDDEIEQLVGMSIPEVFSTEGESHFRQIEQAALHQTAKRQNLIVATGGGTPCFFDNMEFMNRTGITIYFEMTPELLAERLLTTDLSSRPLLAGFGIEDLQLYIAENLEARESFYKQARLVLNVSEGNLIELLVSRIVEEQKQASISPMIHVSCALIEQEGRVLICRRSTQMKMPLKWEFPGGKIEEGESSRESLIREIREELGVLIEPGKAFKPVVHQYDTFSITLYPFIATIEKGAIQLKEHDQSVWTLPEKLTEYDFAEADRAVVAAYLAHKKKL